MSKTNRMETKKNQAKLLLALLFVITTSNAQFWKKLTEKVEQKVNERIDRKIDKTIDDTLDKAVESGKNKKSKKRTNSTASSFSFNKEIEVEIKSDNQTYSINFLLGKYTDTYGMLVKTKEMQGQGKVLVVTTPKSSTMFMDIAGMKMKKTTSLEKIGNQYNITKELPNNADFEYKKTGNTKTIIGYTCEEYFANYNYENNKVNSILWVSKDFPIQNMYLPMLGMNPKNKYFKGVALEINTKTNNQNITIKVIKVAEKSVTINTNEYRKMGF